MPVSIDHPKLNSICRRYGVRELFVFGSATRSDFTERSDVDLLVEFIDRNNAIWDRYFELKFELEALFGRSVDLIDGRDSVRNPIRRRVIFESMERLYAA